MVLNGGLWVLGGGKFCVGINGDWYVSATETFSDFSFPIFGNIPSYTLQKKQHKTNYSVFLFNYATQGVKTWHLCTIYKMENEI